MRKERAVYSNTVASCQLFAFILIRFYNKMFCHQRRCKLWVMPEDMKGRPEQTVQKRLFFFFFEFLSYFSCVWFWFWFGLFVFVCVCICMFLFYPDIP